MKYIEPLVMKRDEGGIQTSPEILQENIHYIQI